MSEALSLVIMMITLNCDWYLVEENIQFRFRFFSRDLLIGGSEQSGPQGEVRFNR